MQYRIYNQSEPLVVSYRISKVANFGKLVYNIYSRTGGNVSATYMAIFRRQVTANAVLSSGFVAHCHDNKPAILPVIGHCGVADVAVLLLMAKGKSTCYEHLPDGNNVTKFTIRIVFFDTIYPKTELQ